MTLPPRWVRRVVLAPGMVLLTGVVLGTLPLWLLLAAVLSPLLPGRRRALRVLWVVVVAMVLESAVLGAVRSTPACRCSASWRHADLPSAPAGQVSVRARCQLGETR